MTGWAEVEFKKGDGVMGMNGDQMFDALHIAIDAVQYMDPSKGDDADIVFRAVAYCLDAAEKLFLARCEMEGLRSGRRS